MKRFLFVLLLGLFLSPFLLRGDNVLAQNLSTAQKEVIYTDQNTTPSQFHQMEAAMKQQRLNEIRKAGIALPLKETKSQSDFDARYYRLDLRLNDTTQILTGAVYVYGTSLINGFNVVELNFFDNAQMFVDSCISNGAHASFTWSSNLIRIFLNGTYNAGQSFGVTVYYHGHPLEGKRP